jgi:hypothetical protein
MNSQDQTMCNLRDDEFYRHRLLNFTSTLEQWLDAGYCLDAPEDIPAGGHKRLDDGKNRAVPMRTFRWMYHF